MSSTRLTIGLAITLVGAAVACAPPPLTRDEAAALLSKSPMLSGVEYLQVVTPHGCTAVAADLPIDRASPRRNPRTLDGRRDALRQEVDLDLVDFELAEAPMVAMHTPLEGCEDVWLSHTSGAQRNSVPRLKMVAWKAFLSDKAVAAGFQPGQSILYRRQTLMAIDDITPNVDGTTAVTYSWRWAPTEQGAHLRIPADDPVRATARFKRTDRRWRVVPR